MLRIVKYIPQMLNTISICDIINQQKKQQGVMKEMYKKTKIICTVGPACQQPEMLEKLALGGANVFRMNFSHGTHEEHAERIKNVKALRKKLKMPLAILLDTKGPEIRTGNFKNGPVVLKEDDMFTLRCCSDELGDEKMVTVTYDDLYKDVSRGSRILIDDGLVGMEVIKIDGKDIVCRVLNGGEVSNHKGVNVPGVEVNLPSITQKDIDDLTFGVEMGIDFVAASFIRKASDVMEIKKVLQDNNGSNIQVISKIENHQGINNIEEIIRASDGVMVARGDLGVEIPMENVPIYQKEIIQMCKNAGKLVITATQMLDSMIRNPRPTRAEVNDVASSVYDGCDAVMLSGETAAGKYPLEALTAMAAICRNIEGHAQMVSKPISADKGTLGVTDAVAHACCETAEDLSARAIISATSSGYTARRMSKYRPNCEIIATTQNESEYHKMALLWGVTPLMCSYVNNTDDMIAASVKAAQDAGRLKDGDIVIISGGVPVGVSGSTNMMKVHVVGAVLLRGNGIGTGSPQGKVCVVRNAQECMEKFTDGDIIVAPDTDNDYLPFIKRATAVICEKNDPSCHAAVVGLALEKPVMVGAEGATNLLHDGTYVTVDLDRGLVLNAR